MDILNFDDIFKKIFINFWLLGIPSKDQINGNPGLKFVILFCSMILMMIEELSFFVSKISSSDYFLEVTALAPLICNCVMSILKILCIFLKHRRIYQLHDSLKELYNDTLLDESKINLVMGKVRMVHQFTNYYLLFNIVVVTLYNFSPLVFIFYDYKVKGKIVYDIPFAVSVPFSIDTFWKWLLVYIHSIECGYLCVAYNTTLDSLYYNLSAQVCCNFAVLGDEIQSLKQHCVGSLSAIVKKHQNILKLSQHLEDVFRAPNLVNVLCGSIQICALGFSLMTGTVTQIPRFGLFLLSQLLLMFFMSIFGENIITESTKIVEKAYLCEWYNMDKKDKKTLLLIMTRAHKPQKLTAYKFSTISYESFTKIISTSWSYFSILRTVYYSNETEQN